MELAETSITIGAENSPDDPRTMTVIHMGPVTMACHGPRTFKLDGTDSTSPLLTLENPVEFVLRNALMPTKDTS